MTNKIIIRNEIIFIQSLIFLLR